MTAKEQLYYLLKQVSNGQYDLNTFADLFTSIFNIQLHKEDCTNEEYEIFFDLNKYTSRFSPYKEDLQLINVFFDKNTLMKQIDMTIKKLRH